MKRTKFYIEDTLTKNQLQKLERQNDADNLITVYREVEGFVSTKILLGRKKPLTIPEIAERTGIDEKRVRKAFWRLDYLLYIKP